MIATATALTAPAAAPMPAPASAPATRAGISSKLPKPGAVATQMISFAVVGAVSTMIQIGAYTLVRASLTALLATLVSLIASSLFNTWANRRFTFKSSGSQTANQVQGLVMTAAVAGVQLASASFLSQFGLAEAVEAVLIALAGCSLGLVRFALMRILFK